MAVITMAVWRETPSEPASSRLERYLRSVRQGAAYIVTHRGEPIAELRRLQEDFDGKLARLRAAGVISGGSGRQQPFNPVRATGAALSDAIIEDREDRF